MDWVEGRGLTKSAIPHSKTIKPVSPFTALDTLHSGMDGMQGMNGYSEDALRIEATSKLRIMSRTSPRSMA